MPKTELDRYPLGKSIRRLRELSVFTGPLLKRNIPFPPGLPKAHLATCLARCIRTARTLRIASPIPGLRPKLRHLRNLDLFDPPLGTSTPTYENQTPWDYLLEVEIAALATVAPVPPRFDEPDVVLTDDYGHEFAWACKRPRTTESLQQAVGRAIHQIEQRNILGIAAIGVDLLTPPGVVIKDRVPAEVEYRKRIDAAIGPVFDSVRSRLRRSELDTSTPGRVYGVMFCAFPLALYWLGHEEGGVLTVPFCARLLSNPAISGSLKVLRWFQSILRVGDKELRMSEL